MKDDALPPARRWTKRLRHRRRDWQWRRRLAKHAPRPTAGKLDPGFSDLAVVAIAILPKYHDWCLSMIDSLRGIGGFHGPVYVVTDDGEPFRGLANVAPLVVPTTRYRLVAKSCKQLLVDWISEPNMLYIDADIILAKPLHPWYARARPLLTDKPLALYTCNMPIAGAYHGGLMLADREKVKPFFAKWLKACRSGRYFFDQEALLSIADPAVIGLFADRELIFLHQILGEDQEPYAEQPPATFVHVTNGMIRRYSRDQIRTYLASVCKLQRIPTAFGREA